MAKKNYRTLTQNQKIRQKYSDYAYDGDTVVGVAMGRNTYPKSLFNLNGGDVEKNLFEMDVKQAQQGPLPYKIFLLPPVDKIKPVPKIRQDLDETKVDIFKSYDEFKEFVKSPEFDVKYKKKTPVPA